MNNGLPCKQRTVVLLRWVLIIAFSYLLIIDPSARLVPAHVALLVVIALASNLVIARIPERWTQTRLFDSAIILFDAGWVTLGLTWAPNVSGDLFLLYFLVIFVAAMGESLQMIVGSAIVVSVAYGAMLTRHAGANLQLTAALLRVPFLFVVALFYGYFVAEIRGRRKEAAEARLGEHAKTELLAAVSHDLRAPLSNAENLLALILTAQAEGVEPERDLLLRTQVNVRRVTSLLMNLLQAACIEAGEVRFQFAPVQLNDVVDDVFDLEAGAAILRDIALIKDVDPQLPVVTADLVQVGRIVTNLVNNAIKYTHPSGTVTIRTASDDDSVRISVQDSGPGLSPEQCAALFAAYRRVHVGGYTPGTGLGLYIVKRLTEAQGGAVYVSSTVGTGSTFVVSFPRIAPVTEASTRAVRLREQSVPARVSGPQLPAGVGAQAA